MLKQNMRRLIQKSDPSQNLVVVVLLDPSLETRNISKISDPQARGRAMAKAIWKVKQPVIEAVERYRDMGVHVVNDVEGAPTVVLAGPARAWKVMVGDKSSMMSDPRVQFVSNEPVYAT